MVSRASAQPPELRQSRAGTARDGAARPDGLRECAGEAVRAPKRSQQRHDAVVAHHFGDAGAGVPGKGEDQRTILPSLNLIV